MNAPAPVAEADSRPSVDAAARRSNGAGRAETTAAALISAATAFFWWRGFRAFTVAGAILFVVALIRLGAHRRRLLRGPASVERPTAARLMTMLAVLLFPGLLVLRSLDAVSWLVAVASADIWLGSLLYVMGIMELVELATLRELDEP